MEVTVTTWVVAKLGFLIMSLLMSLQAIAALKPESDWTIKNVYGSNPSNTNI